LAHRYIGAAFEKNKPEFFCLTGRSLARLQYLQAVGGDTSEGDPMLNGAKALVGAYGVHQEVATTFVDWLVKEDGGQKVIKDFAVNGEVLYTVAPPGVDPLARVRDFL
jgi:hypothetical protein